VVDWRDLARRSPSPTSIADRGPRPVLTLEPAQQRPTRGPGLVDIAAPRDVQPVGDLDGISRTSTFAEGHRPAPRGARWGRRRRDDRRRGLERFVKAWRRRHNAPRSPLPRARMGILQVEEPAARAGLAHRAGQRRSLALGADGKILHRPWPSPRRRRRRTARAGGPAAVRARGRRGGAAAGSGGRTAPRRQGERGPEQSDGTLVARGTLVIGCRARQRVTGEVARLRRAGLEIARRSS
jgi:hypothetical protein